MVGRTPFSTVNMAPPTSSPPSSFRPCRFVDDAKGGAFLRLSYPRRTRKNHDRFPTGRAAGREDPEDPLASGVRPPLRVSRVIDFGLAIAITAAVMPGRA